jgi:hypothetical protein
MSMDLKNAAAVCLISLFSATLVVLIARALDSQAASQLEPQLASIVEELQAIRQQGRVAPAVDAHPVMEPASDRLAIYFFHATARCPSCEAVESTTEELLRTEFASQYKRGEITWKTLSYEKPAAAELVHKFDVGGVVIVLAKMKDDQLQDDWKSLGKVMALAGDKPALAAYVRDEIKQMLPRVRQSVPMPSEANGPAIPVPETKTTDPVVPKEPPAIPIPE